MSNQAGRRPSAHDQQTHARGLLVVASVLAAVFAVSVGVLWATVSGASAQAAAGLSSTNDADQGQSDDQSQSDGASSVPIVQDAEAPVEQQADDASDSGADTNSNGEAAADSADSAADDAASTTDASLTGDERASELAVDASRQTDWSFSTNGEKIVYLTFDDGPSYNTPKVLDILDQYNAKATFFVTGHDAEHRSCIKDAYDRGHTIGLHSYTHDYATIYTSVDAYFNDLDQVGQIVKEQIGFVPYLIRFPGGASNTISANYCQGIMTTLSAETQARGYQYYDWNISSNDAAGTNVAVDTIVSASCQEGWTNIVLLFHDSNTKDTTVEALPQILQFYSERGYVFKALNRSSFVCHHAIGN